MTRLISTALFAVSLTIAPASTRAAGPAFFRADSGVASGGAALPHDLSGTPQWKQSLDPGQSTPCVCGDSIYVTSFDAEASKLATIALDRSTGDVRWKQIAPTKEIEVHHSTGSPAVSSVACDGERVFSFFGSFGLLCYSLDGKLLWSKSMGPFQDEFGASSSPVLIDGKVILNQDHDVDNFIMAIDAANGKTVWRTPREGTRSYSTPVIWNVDGKPQIVVAGSLRLTAYNPQDGSPIWWVDGLSRIVDTTPAIEGNMLFAATWTPGGDQSKRIAMGAFADALEQFDKNGDKEVGKDELTPGAVLTRFFRIDLNQNQKLDENEWNSHARVFDLAQNVAMAVKAGGRGDVTKTHVKWLQRRNLPTVPSPLALQGVVYMVKSGGILTSLDAKSGELLHQGRLEGRGNYYASLVAGDGVLYSASEGGVVTIVKAGGELEVVSSHDFGERIMATPIAVDGQLFVRTDNAIYCFVR